MNARLREFKRESPSQTNGLRYYFAEGQSSLPVSASVIQQ